MEGRRVVPRYQQSWERVKAVRRFGLGEDTLGSRLWVQLMEGSKGLGPGHF